ncbi:DNA-methyltransferase [Cylindrospermopsis raciborskii]|uniref:DNA-methyltransferase n=1 Tax=Cylindrospermopsis raciborskii TaxID=77022 RepID=UPI003BF7E553
MTSGQNRSSKERTPHPAQFPVELISRIILASSHPGDIIFDPFFSSGSIAEAAIKTGRKAIGIEINPNYVNIAVQRVKNIRYEEENQVTFATNPSPLEWI